MNAIDCMMTRRSVRTFTEQPVSRADLETILRAGMQAPSAANKRPWQFIVIEDKDLLAELSTSSPPHKVPMHNATAAIIACTDWALDDRPVNDNSDHGVIAVMENMLLAIHAMGLGGVWLAIAPRQQIVDHVRQTLHIPEGIDPCGMIALGHPAESPQPEDRYEPDKIHWGGY